MAKNNEFYLGRIFDPAQGKLSADSLLYDPEDLTTHAVVVGMTGSGKTGLCIGMLEEAALKNIPALLIDPKGDITNLLLHFPNLLPQDFQPWVNPDEARRADQTIEQAASETAARWKKGLADWGIEPARIQELKDSAEFAIYTPGSDAGIPISILASLQAPELAWDENEELLLEKISSTVTALLSLVGYEDIDPVRSREHILLSNIFQFAWSQGQDLDLGELILQTQEPPFPKLGVMDVNRFFPEKERFELAMLLNNILAAPAFQSWLEGQPLNIPNLLYAPNGQARHSVFYIAHLSDQERMFFITLLYSAVDAWMRTQPGTTSLRAIVYFDEIFGYLPPTRNPPSKMILLRLLKQARAFGIGQVLVTQNPVDLDYKALSNTGTWMIGKLQTDQDKQRLLDGLQGALAGGMDRQAYDKLISGLGKRVFLMHNVHSSKPSVFQTRWAMNYLAGPLTRAQIPALNDLANPAPVVSKPAGAVTAASAAVSTERPTKPTPKPAQAALAALAAKFSMTQPPTPAGFREYFLPNNLSLSEAFQAAGKPYPASAQSQDLIYRPILAAQASTRYLNRRYNVDFEQKQPILAHEPDRRGMVRWEDFTAAEMDERRFDPRPGPNARFAALEAPLSDARLLAAMQKDFSDWAYRSSELLIQANEELGVYAGPQVSQAEFRRMCSEAAEEKAQLEIDKATAALDKKIAAEQAKIDKEQRELQQDRSDYNQRKMDEVGAGFDTVMGLFGGRKRSISKNVSKRRMTATAKADVEESEDAIADSKKLIAQYQADKDQAVNEINQRWAKIAGQASQIKLVPQKKDVLLDFFGIAWFPTYLVEVGDETIELPGYAA